MRSREAKGQRIVKVLQTRFWNSHTAEWSVACDGIELEDGSVLAFHTIETGDAYAVGVSRYTITVDLGHAVEKAIEKKLKGIV